MKQKLFSILCCLLLSAGMAVHAGTYNFSWSNTTITQGTFGGGSWNNNYANRAYRYVATTNGGYPKLYIYILPFNMSSYGSGTYPYPKTYSVLSTNREETPAEGIINDNRYNNSSSSYRIDFNWEDFVRCRLEISSSNIYYFTSGSFTFQQGANGMPYVSSSGLTHTITIGDQLLAGTITAEASPAEGGTVSVNQPSTAGGSSVTLTATKNSGYEFLKWQNESGTTISTTATTTVSVNGDATYTAVFAPARTLTVQVANNQSSYGTVSGGGTYAQGATVTISATANSGYQFSQWNDGNTDSQRTITISSDNSENTYTAYFEEYTSHLSIVSCSSGADIEAHFDYSNVTTNRTDEVGVNDFTADGSNYCYVYYLTAKNSSNDELTLYFFPEYIRTYQGGECTQELSQTPAPNSYPLQKQSLYESYYYDTWYVTKNTAFVYNHISNYNATSPHCDIIMQNNSNKHWDLDEGGSIVISENNVGGLFIETENVTEKSSSGQSVYFTLGNRSENTFAPSAATMTVSGNNLTLTATDNDDNNAKFVIKGYNTNNTSYSLNGTTGFNLDRCQLYYGGKYIEEIQSISGTIQRSVSAGTIYYTLSAKIRTCREDLYIINMTAPAPSYNLTWDKNAEDATLTGGTSGQVQFTASITQPTISRPGYNYTWSPTPVSTMPAQNVAYTAQWTHKTYTLTATTNPANLTTVTFSPAAPYHYGDEATLAAPEVTGYTFSGWGGTNSSMMTGNVFTFSVDAANNTPYSVTANYTAIEYPITYHNTEGTSIMNLVYTIEETPVDLWIEEDKEKDGYTFAGWYDNEGLTGSVVTTIPAGSTGNKDFWAAWTPDTYLLTLDKGTDGTADGSATATYNSNTLISVSHAAKTTGSWTLSGYFTAASEGTKVINADGTLVANVTGYTDAEGKWIRYEGDMTLYAQWEEVHNPAIVLYDNETATDEGVATTYGALLTKYGVATPVDVTLTRTFAANQWNTISLPFDVDLEYYQGGAWDNLIYEITSCSADETGMNIMFGKADEIEAGKPYIIRAESVIENPVFEGVMLTTFEETKVDVAGNVEFHPTLSVLEPVTDKHYIFISRNRLYYPNQTSGTGIRAFRAYFKLIGFVPAAPVRIRIADTGETITLDEEQNETETRKYVEDGILIIERGGIRYDAQGKIMRNE